MIIIVVVVITIIIITIAIIILFLIFLLGLVVLVLHWPHRVVLLVHSLSNNHHADSQTCDEEITN